MTLQLTVIGLGNLGAAVASGVVDDHGDERIGLTVCGRRAGSLDAWQGKARISYDVVDAATGADVVVIAVKPKDTIAVLEKLQPALKPTTLVVSCAAGIPIAKLRTASAVARAMPNIGALRGQSTTAVVLGPTDDVARDR
ncbi:MAG TPA: NAD(P)-binding domain-containing protein, partial [Myxococcota bacterium]